MSNQLIRKNHSSSFKFTVVLNYLKGDKTAAELSKQHGISANSIHKWVKQFKEKGKDLFDQDSSLSHHKISTEKELSNLYRKIGELTIERDFLKKALDA